MENRMTARVFCLLAAFLGGCGDVGIFKAISEEVELSSNRTAPGNILSIVRYGTALYAAGGRIYRKDNYTEKGGWESIPAPGYTIRLAAGYSGDEEEEYSKNNEYLYALTAKADDSGNPTYRLYYFPNAAGGWQKVTGALTGNLQTIFSNHAVNSGGNTANHAYVTTSEKIYELKGGSIADVDATDVAHGASPSSVAAAYMLDDNTYFADTAAFASDGTYLFKGDGTKISYGTATPLKPAVEVEGISNTIMSLWAYKTEETEETLKGTLYIGMKYGGVKQAAYTVNPDSTLTFDEAKYPGDPGGNTYAALGNYDIPVVFVTAGEEAVYASTVGITATQGTKKNGLWGYYPGERETWDWE